MTQVTLYAIQDKNTGNIVNHRNVKFYTSRRQAREAKRTIVKDNLIIVTSTFIKEADWTKTR